MRPPAGVLGRLGLYLSLVRFSHSVFALPFALVGLLLATDGRPSLGLLALVVAAAVAARTAAMAFNRLVDRRFDAANPRTRGRELPSGRLAPRDAAFLAAGASAVFVVLAGLLNALCLLLSPFVLAVLLGYSWAKRFTWMAHFWLGAALGLAPPGAWLAATATFAGPVHLPLLLGLAVALWVAGFDAIYACLDREEDLRAGLHSLPARFGTAAALRASAVLHAVSLLLLALFGVLAGLSAVYHAALVAVGLLLLYQHRIVTPQDLSRAGFASLALNGPVSVLVLAAVLLDLWAI